MAPRYKSTKSFSVRDAKSSYDVLPGDPKLEEHANRLGASVNGGVVKRLVQATREYAAFREANGGPYYKLTGQLKNSLGWKVMHDGTIILSSGIGQGRRVMAYFAYYFLGAPPGSGIRWAGRNHYEEEISERQDVTWVK